MRKEQRGGGRRTFRAAKTLRMTLQWWACAVTLFPNPQDAHHRGGPSWERGLWATWTCQCRFAVTNVPSDGACE